jgi:hypothetical protein
VLAPHNGTPLLGLALREGPRAMTVALHCHRESALLHIVQQLLLQQENLTSPGKH